MIAPNEHKYEKERLKNLDSYDILDTLQEVDYDNITAIAAEICNTPIALVTLLDDKRQWFKSHYGIDETETPKEFAFCAHAINDESNIFMIQDARTDNRFKNNPLVTGGPKIVFYAGVPLKSENGLPLGTLCVIDDKPNLLSKGQLKSLTALSKQVMNLLELRKSKSLLNITLSELEEKNQELERFAFIAAHDLKSPLINISSLAELFLEDYKLQIDTDGIELLEMIIKSSDNLKELINGLLDYSRSDVILKEQKSDLNLNKLISEIEGLFNFDHNLKLVLNSNLTQIEINKTALSHIIMNLVSNAIKYNDKPKVEIELDIFETPSHYEFYVKDNGPGIAAKNHSKIFNIFEKVANHDRFGREGNGIGLATVKKIVEKLEGQIKVVSELGNGATFIFTIKK
ncbi:sensor histidine kinase [Winogradskyella psychrotolerans]|uniref:sensor histidine kinase n=1 Tax=Winogradskyella psychrotolerans TaxID=1344585 RepID=UPI001C074BF3|nr:GAF domain-containing sensor histidine kinase [Winogradskyella psychrotolerans]MBU2927010.1 GAF domain-containing sensor histidine kinase [Winogradskyella psychrotolerans]